MNFVVEGDFFDGEEFQPVIMTEDDQNALVLAEIEPEEVDNDFIDENNDVAVPIADDQTEVGRNTQVSTFNYAGEPPAFLRGLPSDVPLTKGQGSKLDSAVVSLSSKQKNRAQPSVKSELINAKNRDTKIGQSIGLDL